MLKNSCKKANVNTSHVRFAEIQKWICDLLIENLFRRNDFMFTSEVISISFDEIRGVLFVFFSFILMRR